MKGDNKMKEEILKLIDELNIKIERLNSCDNLCEFGEGQCVAFTELRKKLIYIASKED